MELELRLAHDDDAEAIRRIYNYEVEHSTVTFDIVPRDAAAQQTWMAEHGGVYPVLVATDAGRVVGFASLSPYRPRPAYATTVEDSVYVAASHRGTGVGTALLRELCVLAASHGFHAVIARIVGDHEASIGLHARCGFAHVGVEREVGRKFGRWLDVCVMQRLV